MQLFYLWIVDPIMISFYETEVKDTICKRIWQAVRIQLPLFLFLIIVTIPTYFFLNEVKLDSQDIQWV